MRNIAILAVILGVLLSCSTVWAEGYGGGTGDPNNPYIIADANHMQAIGANPSDWGACFVLLNNINLVEYTGTQFNIIGNSTTAFTGVFDGNDQTISNFTYTATEPNYIGLFGYVC